MKRKRPLDYIYLYQTDQADVRYTSGVEFEEFIKAHGPTPLLLLKHQYGYFGPGEPVHHWPSGFTYVPADGIGDLIADNPYSYGDFHLLDLPDVGALDRLEKQEVAETLYLSHKWEPFTTPYLPTIGNSFALLAHDDWWYVKIFYRDPERFYGLYGEVLRKRIERMHDRRLPPLPAEVIGQWAEWAKEGLYIDLNDVTRSRNEFTLGLYLLGRGRAPFSPGGSSIDEIVKPDRYKEFGRRVLLRCLNRRWSVEG